MAGTAVRWGVLGGARIARERLIPLLQATPRSTVLAVASRDAQRAATMARDFAIPRWYAGYDALLADPEVDAVYIPLPPNLHAEWTLRAIAAGKAVLCEKPLATSYEDAVAITDAASEAGLLVTETQQYRHHPRFRALLALIEWGELGPVRLVRASFGYRATEKHRVRLDPALGGGAILDLGCYLLDALRLIFGGARPEQVEAIVTLAPSGVDDLAAATLRYPDARIGIIDCSLRLPWRAAPLEVVGELRSARLEHAFNPGDEETAITLLDEAGSAEVRHFPPRDPYRTMVEDFVASLLDGVSYPFPIAGAVDTFYAVDQLLRLAPHAG